MTTSERISPYQLAAEIEAAAMRREEIRRALSSSRSKQRQDELLAELQKKRHDHMCLVSELVAMAEEDGDA